VRERLERRGGSLAGVEVADAVTDLWASSHHQAAIVTITEQVRKPTDYVDLREEWSVPLDLELEASPSIVDWEVEREGGRARGGCAHPPATPPYDKLRIQLLHCSQAPSPPPLYDNRGPGGESATPEITGNGSTPPEPISADFASLDLVAVVTVAIVAVVGAIITCSGGREAGGSREGPGETNLVGCSLLAASGN
uniref:Uncharacterized protein n=1 Tax=Oryza meridionalis TaxID=40149 RepID=A0A0E0CJ78_9ORYZ